MTADYVYIVIDAIVIV